MGGNKGAAVDVGVLVRTLGEDALRARVQLAAVLALLGPIVCRELLDRTAEIEREEGLRRADGARRTRGGVFFELARERLSAEERKVTFDVLPRRLKRMHDKDVTVLFEVAGAREMIDSIRRTAPPREAR